MLEKRERWKEREREGDGERERVLDHDEIFTQLDLILSERG